MGRGRIDETPRVSWQRGWPSLVYVHRFCYGLPPRVMGTQVRCDPFRLLEAGQRLQCQTCGQVDGSLIAVIDAEEVFKFVPLPQASRCFAKRVVHVLTKALGFSAERCQNQLAPHARQVSVVLAHG